MKLKNAKGQKIYFNAANKGGREVYIVKTLSGQSIPNRDRKPHKSRTFTQIAQAEKWLERNGYK